MNREEPKTYVNFKTADLLEEIGFDMNCRGCYIGNAYIDAYFDNILNSTGYKKIHAPSIHIVQKWLRDEHGYDVIVTRILPLHELKYSYEYEYTIINNEGIVEGANAYFEEYDDALVDGINKVCNLIIEKIK